MKIMAKGLCSSCGKEIGTFFGPSGYQCRNCMQLFCFNCSKKIGLIFKKPVCPNCGIPLVDDARMAQLRDERLQARAIGFGMEEGRRRAIEAERQRIQMEAERRRMARNAERLVFGGPPTTRQRKFAERMALGGTRAEIKEMQKKRRAFARKMAFG